MSTNLAARPCDGCKKTIPARAGVLEGPPWRCFCARCRPKPRARAATVMLDLVDGHADVRLLGFFDSFAYTALREAAKRAGAHVRGRSIAVELHGARALREALERVGAGRWAVDVTAAFEAALAELEGRARGDLAAATERARAANETLERRGLALRPYQKRGVEWLAPLTSGLLADEPGLGKTIQALLAAPAGAPVLVICPAVAKGVWAEETRRWRPDLAVDVLEGRGSFRWPNPGELVVTNFDILPNELPPNPPKGLVVIGDECQAIKNRGTRKKPVQRTIRFRAIAAAARRLRGRSWGLSGTPFENHPKELYQVLEAFGLEGIFGGWARFVELMAGQQDRWNAWQWGKPSDEVPAILKRVMLRRERKDVAKDIPKKSYKTIHAKIGRDAIEEADAALATLREAGLVSTEGDEKMLARQLREAVAEAIKTRTGVAFQALSRARKALATAKTAALFEIVSEYEDAEEPLVAFSAHKAPVLAFKKREGWAVITGATSNAERTRIVADFQAGRLHGLAATIRSAGVALTLTHACHAVFVDLDWVPARNQQAEDRVTRIGQMRPVLITRLVADHELDERVLEVLAEKMAVVDATIGAAAVREPEPAPAPPTTEKPLRPDARRATTPHDLWILEKLNRLTWFVKEFGANDDDMKRDGELAQRALDAHQREGLVPRGWTYVLAIARRWRTLTPDREPEDPHDPRRAPVTPLEHWIAKSLGILHGLDPENDARFRRRDRADGGAWAHQALDGKGLSEREWTRAKKMLEDYREEVGSPPKEKKPDAPDECSRCEEPAVVYAWDPDEHDDVLLCEKHAPKNRGLEPGAVFPSRCHGGESRRVVSPSGELVWLQCRTCGLSASPSAEERQRFMLQNATEAEPAPAVASPTILGEELHPGRDIG